MGREQELLSEYHAYDRWVDIVAVAEVWFCGSEGIAPTVEWFERFPTYRHADGEDVSPDFTSLFEDKTAIVGELSSLSLRDKSLDSLCHQIGRYDALRQVPAGPPDAGALADVEDLDVVVFMPHRVANAGAARLAEAMADPDHFYKPRHQPVIIGWSYDATEDSYTFTRDAAAGNPRPRDHARVVGLGSWLEKGYDTLRGVPWQFAKRKVRGRFMNDEPPPLYTATVLWAETFKDLLAEQGLAPPQDIETSTPELAEFMRGQYGFGTARVAERALRFLKTARLASESGKGWTVHYRELRRTHRETVEALISKYLAASSGRAQAVERATSQTEDEAVEPERPSLFDRSDDE
ncbi:MAG: hypothetical protein ACRDL0_03100 [Thermoleophilaceae bacterium]